MTNPTPNPEWVEKAARAICAATGVSPDERAHGSGSTTPTGGTFHCSVYQWERFKGHASAALATVLPDIRDAVLEEATGDEKPRYTARRMKLEITRAYNRGIEDAAEFAEHEFQRNFESTVGWRAQFAAAIRGKKEKSNG